MNEFDASVRQLYFFFFFFILRLFNAKSSDYLIYVNRERCSLHVRIHSRLLRRYSQFIANEISFVSWNRRNNGTRNTTITLKCTNALKNFELCHIFFVWRRKMDLFSLPCADLKSLHFTKGKMFDWNNTHRQTKLHILWFIVKHTIRQKIKEKEKKKNSISGRCKWFTVFIEEKHCMRTNWIVLELLSLFATCFSSC